MDAVERIILVGHASSDGRTPTSVQLTCTQTHTHTDTKANPLCVSVSHVVIDTIGLLLYVFLSEREREAEWGGAYSPHHFHFSIPNMLTFLPCIIHFVRPHSHKKLTLAHTPAAPCYLFMPENHFM